MGHFNFLLFWGVRDLQNFNCVHVLDWKSDKKKRNNRNFAKWQTSEPKGMTLTEVQLQESLIESLLIGSKV